jgi:hypothetical protein
VESVADLVQKKVQNEFPFFKGEIFAAFDSRQKHGTAIAINIVKDITLAVK